MVILDTHLTFLLNNSLKLINSDIYAIVNMKNTLNKLIIFLFYFVLIMYTYELIINQVDKLMSVGRTFLTIV